MTREGEERIHRALLHIIQQNEAIMASVADLTTAVASLTAEATTLTTTVNEAVAAIQAGANVPDQVLTDLNTAISNLTAANTALAAVIPAPAA